MKKIDPADLIPLDSFNHKEPIKIDLVYANKNHPRNIFQAPLYLSTARLWAHKDIAAITLMSARILNKKYSYTLEIQDCLRTIDSQQAMQETDIVKAHPEWCEDGSNRLLAPPGHGGHPRGMAIDVRVLKSDGTELDMGTPFDHMDETSARNYLGFNEDILNNRKILENSFMESAKQLGFPFLPLPSEWWDFRFPASYYNNYAPLRDADLPPQMQMTQHVDSNIPDFDEIHFSALAQQIFDLIETKDGNL